MEPAPENLGALSAFRAKGMGGVKMNNREISSKGWRRLTCGLIFSSLLGLQGCSGGQSFQHTGFSNLGIGSGSVVPDVPVRAHALSGKISYQRPALVTSTTADQSTFSSCQFNYGSLTNNPCRFVKVQIVDREEVVLNTGSTDATGNYSMNVPEGTSPIRVKIFAETAGNNAPIVVQDRLVGGQTYYYSGELELRDVTGMDLLVPTGFTPSGTIDPNGKRNGPLACLDSILSGYQYFLTAGLAPGELTTPTCKVIWQDSTPTTTGGSFFQSGDNAITISGYALTDPDEYDAHVVVHEFGHWMQFNTAHRLDSPGGVHYLGEVYDPRLAFGEGFGNAFSGLVLRDPVYKDAKTLPSGGFSFSMEYNQSPVLDPNPGWYSEVSIAAIILDLFDPVNPAESSGYNDALALPSSDFLKAFKSMNNSSSVQTIFSFLDGLKLTGANANNLGLLLAKESKNADFGLNSIHEFGDGETHGTGATNEGGGVHGAFHQACLEIGPQVLPAGPGITFSAWQLLGGYQASLAGSRQSPNYLRNTQFARFTGDTTLPMTIKVENSSVSPLNNGSVGLEVYEGGKSIYNSRNIGFNPGTDLVCGIPALKVGTTYVVVFTNYAPYDSATNTNPTDTTTPIKFQRI